jgi:hypothetical protein
LFAESGEASQQLQCAAPRSLAIHPGGRTIFAKNARTLAEDSWSSMMTGDLPPLGFGFVAVTIRAGIPAAGSDFRCCGARA